MKLFNKKNKADLPYEDEEKVGFSDKFAMWLSGMLVIAVPSMIMILIVVGAILLIFTRS